MARAKLWNVPKDPDPSKPSKAVRAAVKALDALDSIKGGMSSALALTCYTEASRNSYKQARANLEAFLTMEGFKPVLPKLSAKHYIAVPLPAKTPAEIATEAASSAALEQDGVSAPDGSGQQTEIPKQCEGMLTDSRRCTKPAVVHLDSFGDFCNDCVKDITEANATDSKPIIGHIIRSPFPPHAQMHLVNPQRPEPEHTPRPWQVRGNGQTVLCVFAEGGDVAEIPLQRRANWECRANAELIARAPDYLEALQDIFQVAGMCQRATNPEVLKSGIDQIAKLAGTALK